MPIPSINFTISTNGLGALPANEDYISGFLFYSSSLPSGYSSYTTKLFYSLTEAEDAGLTSTAFPVFNYHIKEFFRMAGSTSQIFIHIANLSGNTFDFAEIKDMQRFAEGKIRQVGVYAHTRTFSKTDATAIQTQLEVMRGEQMPLVSLYSANATGITTSAFDDFRTVIAYGVGPVVGQSGSGTGYSLSTGITHSVSMIGTVLGTLASSGVSESIGWTAKFPIDSGLEMSTPALLNGVNVKSLDLSAKNALDNKGLIYGLKYNTASANTFINFGNNAVAATNDLNSLERVRTINKVQRNLYTVLFPYLNSQIKLNSNGTLSNATINSYENTCNNILDEMKRTNEISDGSVVINPAQNVLQNNTVAITIRILPVGIAKYITVNLGFVQSL